MIDQSEPGQNTLVNFFEHSSFFMMLLLLLILSGAIYVVVAPHPAGTMELQEGQISPYTLYADFDFQTGRHYNRGNHIYLVCKLFCPFCLECAQ